MNQIRESKRIVFVLLLQVLIIGSISFATSESTIPNFSYKYFKNGIEPRYVWSTAQVLSNESSGRSLRPTITADSNDNIHIVWMDQTDYERIGLDDDIFHKVWNATTEVWSEITVLSPSGVIGSVDPIIKADEYGNVHLIWRDGKDILGAGLDTDVFYRFWNVSTGSWSNIEIVSPHSTGNIYWAYLDVKENNTYVVWQDTTDYLGNGLDEDVLFSKRYNNGTWTNALTLSVEGSSNSIYPFILVDNKSNVHVSWEGMSNYLGSGVDMDIFYRYLNATTGSWSAIEVISSSSTLYSDRSKIAIDSLGNKYILWVDYTNLLESGLDHDIFYRIWNATTEAWSNVKLLSNLSNGNSDVASIIIDANDNIYTVWFDTTNIDSADTDQDVFFKYWNSTAKSWSDYTLVSTHSTFDSWRPDIDINSQNQLHVVWQDRTINYGGSGADIDILYSKGIIPEPSPYLIFRDKPENSVYLDDNTKSYNLSWTASDANVSSPNYILFINDIENRTGSWITDRSIEFHIADLAIGNYTYRLDVEDGLSEMISDEVLVVVTTAIKEWVKPVLNFLWGVVIAAAPVVTTSIIVLIITKRRL
ncbi:MAG: hypothetical protein ACTSWD_07045 [Candidatus Heimdallarchaeota archaeon]